MPRKSFEHIKLKSSNLEPQQNFKHEDFVAGIAPNLRGIYATMYIKKPWEIRQCISFSSAKEGNIFYKKNPETHLKELSITFNVETQNTYDSDDEILKNLVSKTSVNIDSVEDMKMLFYQVPLDKISVSITSNDAILPLLAFYIVAAEEQEVPLDQLSGIIQYDVLKDLMVKETDIVSPNLSMKIFTDIFKYTSNKMPKFNSFSISGFHMQEANTTAEIELAYTFSKGLEFIKKSIEAGIDIDTIASKLSFFWAIGMDHFTEIAKLRAARMLWAKIVKQFNPKNQNSFALRTHCKTNNSSLKAQDPFNKIARTTIEAMAAAFGGTESLYTNTLNESNAFLKDYSNILTKDTQLFLQQETHITKTVDPWAGSFRIEKLTEEIANRAWSLLKEVNDLGGLTKAIEKGIPKKRIEETATKKQTKIIMSKEVLIDVNKHQLKQEDSLRVSKIDSDAVRKSQIEKLQLLKANRNPEKVKNSLANLTKAAKSGKENLLDLTVKAARNSATLSEISNALEIGFNSYKTSTKL
ncbi:methylmalonyl-CoA mutase [Polaribacter sp. KT25b]|uniref:methylmalonyl-CoA mutase family protein n=1 Tax=Polaribacter sp. KT25b TaxID=1855336 RepID=UPI00087DC7CA|nr:methylmalonyl-CoA mutase family protein [Polaribacter sp. KT25b]SDS25706.1 methylmalonyl-CoA mutase [Polaribacter sp. KT25b]